ERAEIDDEEAAALRIATNADVLTGHIHRRIDPHVGSIRDAAAADDDRIARDVERVRSVVVLVPQARVNRGGSRHRPAYRLLTLRRPLPGVNRDDAPGTLTRPEIVGARRQHELR